MSLFDVELNTAMVVVGQGVVRPLAAGEGSRVRAGEVPGDPVALLGGLAVAGSGHLGAQTNSSETYRQLNLFGAVFERVRAQYVEDVSEEKLFEAAINGMLASLDPHSSFLNA